MSNGNPASAAVQGAQTYFSLITACVGLGSTVFAGGYFFTRMNVFKKLVHRVSGGVADREEIDQLVEIVEDNACGWCTLRLYLCFLPRKKTADATHRLETIVHTAERALPAAELRRRRELMARYGLEPQPPDSARTSFSVDGSHRDTSGGPVLPPTRVKYAPPPQINHEAGITRPASSGGLGPSTEVVTATLTHVSTDSFASTVSTSSGSNGISRQTAASTPPTMSVVAGNSSVSDPLSRMSSRISYAEQDRTTAGRPKISGRIPALPETDEEQGKMTPDSSGSTGGGGAKAASTRGGGSPAMGRGRAGPSMGGGALTVQGGGASTSGGNSASSSSIKSTAGVGPRAGSNERKEVSKRQGSGASANGEKSNRSSIESAVRGGARAGSNRGQGASKRQGSGASMRSGPRQSSIDSDDDHEIYEMAPEHPISHSTGGGGSSIHQTSVAPHPATHKSGNPHR